MNKKGVATSLVLAIIFGLSTLGLGSYVIYDNFNSVANSESNKNLDNTDEQKTTNENSTNSDEIVTTSKENKNEDYGCSIPQINLKSHDVEIINNEISYKYNSHCNSQHSSQGYKVFKNNNVLSLLIYIYYDGGMKSYKSYNVDMNSEKKLENYDLLKIKNIDNTNSDYIKTNLLSIFESLEKSDSAWSSSDLAKKIYDQNILRLKETYYDEYNMFLNDNGDLNIIFEMDTLAGSGHTHKIINLTGSNYFEVE